MLDRIQPRLMTALIRPRPDPGDPTQVDGGAMARDGGAGSDQRRRGALVRWERDGGLDTTCVAAHEEVAAVLVRAAGGRNRRGESLRVVATTR